jgi:uncharacterized protein YggT (Ycf19 family)
MRSLLLTILWILRIYSILIIIWAVMTWIPGLSGSSFHHYLGMPIWPVLQVFKWASIGFIGLQAVIVLLILWAIESMIERHLKKHYPASQQQLEETNEG